MESDVSFSFIMFPVVVLSGSRDNRTIDECARLGAENYLIKPVLFDNFCKVTARLQLRWALLKSGSVNDPG